MTPEELLEMGRRASDIFHRIEMLRAIGGQVPEDGRVTRVVVAPLEVAIMAEVWGLTWASRTSYRIDPDNLRHVAYEEGMLILRFREDPYQ